MVATPSIIKATPRSIQQQAVCQNMGVAQLMVATPKSQNMGVVQIMVATPTWPNNLAQIIMVAMPCLVFMAKIHFHLTQIIMVAAPT